MRRSVQPVTIGRVVETVLLAHKLPTIGTGDLIAELAVRPRRSLEILRMTEAFGFVSPALEGRFSLTPTGKRFVNLLRQRNFLGIHELMMSTPQYRDLYLAISGGSSPRSREELLVELRRAGHVAFNTANLDVLCDWLERLGVIQRDVFDGRLYAVRGQVELPSSVLLAVYQKLNHTENPLIRRTYVEIPRLREAVCRQLGMKRADFDRAFAAVVKRNIGRVELSGAPLDTQAKKARRRVKELQLFEETHSLRPLLSSNPELSGLQVNGRTYFYVAVHGSEFVG